MTDNLDERLAEIEARANRTGSITPVGLAWRYEEDSLWLIARLRDALAEVEAARKDARVYQELYEQRVDTLVQVEAARDAAEAKLTAIRKVCAEQRSWCSDERVDVPSWVATIEAAAGSDAEAVTDR